MGVSFPMELWPKVCKAIVYLINKTPQYLLQWKTPYKKFFNTPLLNHYLRVYRYKAFILIMAVLKKLNKLKWLLLKAWIRYLIGYSFINLYGIWIPLYNKVIIIKDVYCNEEEVFDDNTEIFKYDIKNICLKYLIKIVKNIIYKVIKTALLTTHNNTVKNLEWFYKSEGNKKKIRYLENLVPVWKHKYIIAVFELLPTLPDTPSECSFIIVLRTAMPKNTPSRSLLSVWEYKFESV